MVRKVVYTSYPNQCLPLGHRLLSKGDELLHQVWISFVQRNMQIQLGTKAPSWYCANQFLAQTLVCTHAIIHNWLTYDNQKGGSGTVVIYTSLQGMLTYRQNILIIQDDTSSTYQTECIWWIEREIPSKLKI